MTDTLPHQDLSRHIESDVARALTEDNWAGDLTGMLVPPDRRASATIISRDDACLCGAAWVESAVRQLDPEAHVTWMAADGERIGENQVLCRIEGNARAILAAERTALNFLQLLSGIATTTAQYAEAVKGTAARVYDTRKTLPGLRQAQRYAVRTGGGFNHRFGLSDAILIKENHIAATGGIGAALRNAQQYTGIASFIEIEVETLSELDEALQHGARLILLDNMSLADMREAVRMAAGRAELEISGGVTLSSIREMAEVGIQRISIGNLTKQVQPVDYSMRIA